MLHIDRLTFAILLCRIHLRGLNGEPSLDTEFQHFLRGKDGFLNNATLPGNKALIVDLVSLKLCVTFCDLCRVGEPWFGY